ncbi:hypothetical protein BHE74_00006862 [Ensete ventricosum]|nr:hypothetical protein GW17_00016842 [Ensete ventricosum]RWW84530.1 hypothetical protein BHE74_00006862 [Ensete ventricosum]RZR79805.1 hypothetical protein BHM03_00005641 [Ensete ventricosum]
MAKDWTTLVGNGMDLNITAKRAMKKKKMLLTREQSPLAGCFTHATFLHKDSKSLTPSTSSSSSSWTRMCHGVRRMCAVTLQTPTPAHVLLLPITMAKFSMSDSKPSLF